MLTCSKKDSLVDLCVLACSKFEPALGNMMLCELARGEQACSKVLAEDKLDHKLKPVPEHSKELVPQLVHNKEPEQPSQVQPS